MSVDGDFWQFSGGRLTMPSQTHTEPLDVADSWLVSNGAVRSLDAHFERFAGWIGDDPDTVDQIPQFKQAVIDILPRSGDWFPRIEYRSRCDAGQRLFVRVRPAPELTETATLWTSPEPDPRENPMVKGPDLSLCQQLRRAANLHGATEAVLLDEQGFIADGALSSIVWWRDDVLYGPDESTNWLPSITRAEVFELANQGGYATATERARPEDLAGCEVWSLSSLQGVRGVTSWGKLELATPRLFSAFRKRLSFMATAL